MAQRFGGKYSPPQRPEGMRPEGAGFDGVAPDRLPDPAPRHPLEGRTGWLVAAGLPFLAQAFGAGPTGLARGLGAFALVAAAAFLLREGLRAEAAWNARKVARRPALPRKIFGAVLAGAGLGLGAQAPEIGLWGAIALGLIGTALALTAFGLDPMRDKGMEGIDPYQQDRVAKMVAEGERHLAAMAEAMARANDAQLAARVARFAEGARALFRTVEENPASASAARRYMGVYLQGARDASAAFADLWAQNRDGTARAGFEALLDDLESNFAAQRQKLLEGGREGLEIEIEVLRERLAREGLAPRPIEERPPE